MAPSLIKACGHQLHHSLSLNLPSLSIYTPLRKNRPVKTLVPLSPRTLLMARSTRGPHRSRPLCALHTHGLSHPSYPYTAWKTADPGLPLSWLCPGLQPSGDVGGAGKGKQLQDFLPASDVSFHCFLFKVVTHPAVSHVRVHLIQNIVSESLRGKSYLLCLQRVSCSFIA